MANIQSQIKRNRQNEKRRLRNRDFRGSARSAVKVALVSMASGQDSAAAMTAALSALDKAAAKGAIHHRNAARRKGRLMKRLAAIGQQPNAATTQGELPLSTGITKGRPSKGKAEKTPEAKAKPETKKPAAKKMAAPKTSKK